MANYKTANLKPETMQRLREYAVGDESVDSTVQRLLDDAGTEETPDAYPSVSYDDVREACRAAIREELPTDRL